MKKIVSLILATLCILSFAACGKDIPGSSSNITGDAESSKGKLYATLSQNEAKPGDVVTLSVYVSDVKSLTTIDLQINFDSELATAELSDTSTIPDFIDQTNIYNGNIIYAGFVMDTVDVGDEMLFSVDITISENANEDIEFNMNLISLLQATDETGNATEDISDQIEIAPILLTINK